MHTLTKAFIAGGAGTLIAAFVEPKLMSMFPSVAAGSMQAKALHIGVGGASAAGVFYLLGGHK